MNVYIYTAMKTNALARAIFTVLFYLAVLVLLVVIQFPSFGPRLFQSGNISIKAMPAQNEDGYRFMEISADGLKFTFSEDYPLVLRDSNAREHRLLPESFDEMEKGFFIRFSDGTSLSVFSDNEGLTVWNIQPKTNAVSANIHYELLRSASQAAPGNEGALRMTYRQTAYRVSGARLGENPGELSILAQRGVWKPFYAAPELEEAKPVQSSVFIAQAAMEASAWNKAIASWRDKAWQGLSGPGFSIENAEWKNRDRPDAAYSFDESNYIAYIAEAMRREMYDSARTIQTAVKANHTDKISWLGVPLAGRTNAAMSAFEESNLAELRAIEKQIQARSASMFYKSEIIHFLFDMAPYSLAKEAMNIARQADFSKADPVQAIALIEAWLDAKDYLNDDENPFARAADLVDKTLIPAIRKVEGAFFLQLDADGRCDSLSSLRIGKTLVRLGESTGKSLYTGIGQSLIVSLLNMSEPDGSLPAYVTVKGDSLSKSQEKLQPSLAYKYIGDNSYYPHYISFFKTLGPGSWAWTCAQELQLEYSPEKTVISAFYPVSSVHYLVLYGVKPFEKVQLYDMNYNMDPNFENYNASGYFFKRASNVMYLKMRHKAKKEDLRLYY
ncbi:hypothetical protein MASR2M29_05200 [Spirochaetota bacterium]